MDTHCWIIDDMSDGKHFRQMIFSRFLKYIKSIAKNKREALRSLYNVVKDDVRSPTGSNIRTIMLETGVDPRSLDSYALKAWRVYPPQDEWSVPLLRNLLKIRNGKWEVVYDDENDEAATVEDIDLMISTVCTG